MLGRNSRMSKNVDKTKTPRQKASNVEASNEMKTNSKSSKACSNKASNCAKNCK